MLDLKIYDEDQYDLVPVPLPGRLMIFAGPTGLMCRRNDGTIVAYPETTGGGGAQVPGALELLGYPNYESVPVPAPGNLTLGCVDGDVVVAYPNGAVNYVESGTTAYEPPVPGET